MKKLFRFIIISTCLCTLIILVGRDNLILGTFLIMIRWIIIFVLVILLFIATKGKTFRLRKGLIFVFSILIIETIYVKIKSSGFHLKYNTSHHLKILSYNVYFKNNDKDASLNLIKNGNADLVLLQEVTPDWNNKLNTSLNYNYKIRKPLKGTHGISTYSRYPIKLIRYFNNDSGLPFAQLMETTVKGEKILVCHVHLASPAKAVENPEHFFRYYFENYSLRKKQFKEIEDYTKSIEGYYKEVIFAGDLNTTEYEPLFRDISYNWKNTSKNIFKKSFPNSGKLFSIINLDYILYRKNSNILVFKILNGGGSDHKAIYSEIEF